MSLTQPMTIRHSLRVLVCSGRRTAHFERFSKLQNLGKILNTNLRADAEEAILFIQKIKDNSDGKAPFFESDGWFYQEVLNQVYGTIQEVPYTGRGRRPLPIIVPDLTLIRTTCKRTTKW